MKKHFAFYSITFAILCVLIVTGCSESVNYTQPILYNHKKHLLVLDNFRASWNPCRLRCASTRENERSRIPAVNRPSDDSGSFDIQNGFAKTIPVAGSQVKAQGNALEANIFRSLKWHS